MLFLSLSSFYSLLVFKFPTLPYKMQGLLSSLLRRLLQGMTSSVHSTYHCSKFQVCRQHQPKQLLCLSFQTFLKLPGISTRPNLSVSNSDAPARKKRLKSLTFLSANGKLLSFSSKACQASFEYAKRQPSSPLVTTTLGTKFFSELCRDGCSSLVSIFLCVLSCKQKTHLLFSEKQ